MLLPDCFICNYYILYAVNTAQTELFGVKNMAFQTLTGQCFDNNGQFYDVFFLIKYEQIPNTH